MFSALNGVFDSPFEHLQVLDELCSSQLLFIID